MLNVAQNLPDKAFFRRLNNICIAEDAIANEVMYHNLCWVRSKNKATRMKVKPKEDVARALADIELISYIETNLLQPNKVLDVNMLNSTYRDILTEHGVNKDKISSNYKKYIKELIQDNITNVVFMPSKQKNKPERIMTNLTQAEALNTDIDNEAEEQDFKALWRLSKKIRNDVLSKKWEFDGSFDKCEPPNFLLTCLKWILLGPHKQESTDLAKRTADIEVLTKTTS